MSTNTSPRRQLTRRERRARRREGERAHVGEEQERSTPWFTILVVAVVVLFALGGAKALGLFDRVTEEPLPTPAAPRPTGPVGAAAGERVPELDNRHVPHPQRVTEYNSTPPTSGPHWAHPNGPVAWGIYDAEVPDEAVVHNHEHGGVTISYNQISPQDLAALKALHDRYPRDRFGSRKIVIRPYGKIVPGTIALTSWHWRDVMTAFDERRILAFLRAHINECCEEVP